jgi:hypothetical protein
MLKILWLDKILQNTVFGLKFEIGKRGGVAAVTVALYIFSFFYLLFI